jgi:hypothetical protein
MVDIGSNLKNVGYGCLQFPELLHRRADIFCMEVRAARNLTPHLLFTQALHWKTSAHPECWLAPVGPAVRQSPIPQPTFDPNGYTEAIKINTIKFTSLG